jgi:hypothetical protein
MKPLFFPAALILLILGAAAVVWSLKHNRPEPSPLAETQVATSRTFSRIHGARSNEADPVAPELAALAQRLKDSQSMRARAQRPAPSRAESPAAAQDADEDDLDPVSLARIALSYVGTDPDAEAYWLEMINNPDVSDEDRKDLIEDLNESGFPDPEHPTAADLPLIEARIALLERISSQPMDQTNADAFKEALKDLKEMQAKLKTEPVKSEAATEPPR